jgi:hypothetical protein
MGLLDVKVEEDHSKNFRRALYGIVLAALVVFGIWWLVRFHAEKVTVEKFMNTLVAGQTEQAYQIWKASPSYAYKDFLDDWGPNGYYGPVKSFRLAGAAEPRKSLDSVAVTVHISPYTPFPADQDSADNNKTKEVVIWVDRKDQSLSFPP